MATRVAVLALAVTAAVVAAPGGATVGADAVPAEAASAPSLDIAAVVRDAVAAMPRRGAGAAVVPTAREAALLRRMASALGAGDARAAARVAPALGYQVDSVRDSATGRVLALARETRRPLRGWGTWVVAASGRSELLVEVSHPLADRATEDLGVALLRAAGARALLVAGAHRAAAADGSSDVAHSPRSAFQVVHDALLRPGSTVLQPHGFDPAQHPRAGDAVVSAGTRAGSRNATAVAEALRRAGIDARRYGVDADELGGTTNDQGRTTRAAGASFVHLELAPVARTTAQQRAATVAAVVSALR